jgi:tetratricopeptide (TPR) repeat protein
MPPTPTRPSPTPPAPRGGRGLLAAAALVLIAAWCLRPVLAGGWLWDDATEVTENRILMAPAGLAQIWLAPAGPDYFPLKTTVQWLEWRAWGPDPAGYHAVSLALHLASALLVWRLLRRLGLRWGWLGGLLFAVHPLAVESVAWAAELKNTLSLPLLLLALDAWLDGDPDGRTAARARALLLFTAALLAKSSVVMLPLILLLLAWWRRGRITRRDLAATAPFFAVAAGLGLVTLHFQQRLAIGGWTIAAGGPLTRIARAVLAGGFYFSKAVVPAGLSPLYVPSVLSPSLPLFAGLSGLLLLGVLSFTYRACWGRHALLGLGFFIINLLPVIGLVKISYMRYSWVADHFAYISVIGIAGLAAAGLGAWAARSPRIATCVAAALVAALGWHTRAYAAVFHDSTTLWTYALGQDPASWAAQSNLGRAEVEAGAVADGIAHYRASLALRPELAETHNNLGYALFLIGRSDEALAELRTALRLDPAYADAHSNLGNALARRGDIAGAIREQAEALRLRPGFADAEVNLGNALTQAGRVPEAVAHYEEAVRLRPDFASAHYNWAIALVQAGRLPEASAQFEAATRAAPADARTWNQWGAALAQAGRLAEAEARFARAVALAPRFAAAEANLGSVLLQENRPAEAIPHYEAALRIDPSLASIRRALAYARQRAAAR